MKGIKTFQEKQSATFIASQTTFVVKYIAGYAKGMLGQDRVLLGDKEISAKQKFGVVDIFSTCVKSTKEICSIAFDKCA